MGESNSTKRASSYLTCSEAPFSLNSVCSVLGIEPRKVQRTVSDWAWRKRAGLGAARLPRRTPVMVKE